MGKIQKRISVTTGLKKNEELVQMFLYKYSGARGLAQEKDSVVPHPAKMQELVDNVCSPCRELWGCARKKQWRGFHTFLIPPPGGEIISRKMGWKKRKLGPGCYQSLPFSF